VTENPLRDSDQEIAQKTLTGKKYGVGDFVEDAHLITGFVGIGASL